MVLSTGLKPVIQKMLKQAPAVLPTVAMPALKKLLRPRLSQALFVAMALSAWAKIAIQALMLRLTTVNLRQVAQPAVSIQVVACPPNGVLITEVILLVLKLLYIKQPALLPSVNAVTVSKIQTKIQDVIWAMENRLVSVINIVLLLQQVRVNVALGRKVVGPTANTSVHRCHTLLLHCVAMNV
jgi:hypothetical protein